MSGPITPSDVSTPSSVGRGVLSLVVRRGGSSGVGRCTGPVVIYESPSFHVKDGGGGVVGGLAYFGFLKGPPATTDPSG